MALLVALGGDPFERPSAFDSARLAAVWWAGPVIGLINLIPVLPLDGGHATMTVLDRFLPGKAETVMTYGSVAITVAALVATPFVDRLAGMTVFIGFLLLIQLQGLFAHRQRTAVSPIDAAVAAARAGDRQRAEALLTKAFAQRVPLVQVPSTVLSAAESPELADLIVNLPRPFPRGNPANEYLLTILLVRFGRSREAAEYSAEGFARRADPVGCVRCRPRRGSSGRRGDGGRVVAHRPRSGPARRSARGTRQQPGVRHGAWPPGCSAAGRARDVADGRAPLHVGERLPSGDRRDLANRRACRVVRVGDLIARLGALANGDDPQLPGCLGPAGVHPLDELLAGIATLREVDGHGDDGDLRRDALAGNDLGAHRRPAGADPSTLVVVDGRVGRRGS